MKFAQQLALAGVTTVAVAAGLLWFKNRSENESPNQAAAAAPTQAKQAALPTGAAIQHATRALVPADAWLVADFRGDLTGSSPFADQEGFCQGVPAPARVALAFLPPPQPKDEPVLLLAAASVEASFWGCVRDRVVRAGGIAIAQNDQFEVLKSPSGVIARGPNHSMIFLSKDSMLETALQVLSELAPSAASTGVHAGLYRRMHAEGRPADTSLDVTLALPAGWLEGAGRDADLSPLKFVHAGYVSFARNDSARGGLDCDEPGCVQVQEFLVRAVGDLLKSLPEERAKLLKSSIHIEHKKDSGQVSLRFEPSEGAFRGVLDGLLGGLFGP